MKTFSKLSLLTTIGFLFASVGTLAADSDVALSPSGSYHFRNYGVQRATGYVRQDKGIGFLPGVKRQTFRGSQYAVPAKYTLEGKAGPVEDQGQCGSCWDFSLTTALRGTWITHGKDPGRLSFNYLLNCDKRQQGCNGGDFSAADMFVTPKGAPAYGSDGSYNAIDGKCEPSTAVASTISYKLLGDDGGQYPKAPVPSFQDIAYVVGVLHQPVSIDVAANNDWMNYTDGTYDACSDETEQDINHMVVIEGYDCGKNVDKNGNCVFDAKGNLPAGQGTWLVRNSWGEDWGESGYIRTLATDSKGNKCNAVATDALYFDVTGGD